jgi:hypothetical protein
MVMPTPASATAAALSASDENRRRGVTRVT